MVRVSVLPVPRCATDASPIFGGIEHYEGGFDVCATHGGAGSLQCIRATCAQKYGVSAGGRTRIGVGQLSSIDGDSARWSA